MVAATYEAMGLLGGERPTNYYDPGRFWSGDDLELLGDARTRAKDMVSDAEERTRALVSEAEDRLDEIRVERDAIAGYVEGLNGLIGHIGELGQRGADEKA